MVNEEMVDPEKYCTKDNREGYFYNYLHWQLLYPEHRVPFVFGNDFHTGQWKNPDDSSDWKIWIDIPVFEYASCRYYRCYYGCNPDAYSDDKHFVAKFPQYADKVIPFLHYRKYCAPEKYQEVLTDVIGANFPNSVYKCCYDIARSLKNIVRAKWGG